MFKSIIKPFLNIDSERIWEKFSDKLNLTDGIDEANAANEEEVVEVEGIGRFRWYPMSKGPRYTHPPNVNSLSRMSHYS